MDVFVMPSFCVFCDNGVSFVCPAGLPCFAKIGQSEFRTDSGLPQAVRLLADRGFNVTLDIVGPVVGAPRAAEQSAAAPVPQRIPVRAPCYA
jgi:hypothetical protein